MKQLFTLVVAVVFSVAAMGQGEGNIWYFGPGLGLNFSSGVPIVQNNSAMTLNDLAGVACDSAGNLLFYSDGQTIWDKNHQVMVNGSGLLGDPSAGSAATIVRQPNSELYYVFTTPHFGNGSLCYSVVDMTLNSGLGEVTATKNAVLLASSTEKGISIQHSNGSDVWFVAHEWNTDAFMAYRITASGLNTTPVTSNVGIVHTGGSQAGYNTMGQMNYSPASEKLALAIYDADIYQLFDFDNSTGALSNPISLSGYPRALGVEFSPDGQRLYTTQWTYTSVWQFDLTVYTQSAIATSAYSVGDVTSPGPYYAGYIMLAPDNKIYVAKYGSTYLGCITNPNGNDNTCGFSDNNLDLGVANNEGLTNKMLTRKTTGITRDVVDTKVSVAPNPFTDVLYLNGLGKGVTQVSLFDLTGRELRYQISPSGEVEVDENLATGIYFLKVEDSYSNASVFEKLIKD